MPQKGHTEEQIIAALQRVENGKKVGEVCRSVGISEVTYLCGRNSPRAWESTSYESSENLYRVFGANKTAS